MNRIYKVVWSRARACYVVVSEYAKRTGKGSSTKKLLVALAAAGIMAGGAAGMADAAVSASGDKVTMTEEDANKLNSLIDIAENLGSLSGNTETLNKLIEDQSSYVTLTAENAATLDRLIGSASALMPTAASVGTSGSAGITIQTKEDQTIPTDWVIESKYSRNGWNYADSSIHTVSGAAANDYDIVRKNVSFMTAEGTNNISLGWGTVAGYGLQEYTEDDEKVQAGTKKVGDYKKSEQTKVVFPDGTTSEGRRLWPWAYDETKQYNYATALGIRTAAANTAAMAWGYEAVASGLYATAFGQSTVARGESSLAFGHGAKATGDYSFAGGYSYDGLKVFTVASGKGAFAFGYGAEAVGEYSVAMGYDVHATSQFSSVAIGSWTTASGKWSVALGSDTTASNTAAAAIGYYSEANGERSVALGNYSIANGYSSNAIGGGETAEGARYSMAFGWYARANGEFSTAIGHAASATGKESTSLGYRSKASADYSTAIAGGAASNTYAIAIGFRDVNDAEKLIRSEASGYKAFTINGTASGENSFAIGWGSEASASKAYAIGDTAKASGTASLAIGQNAQAKAMLGTALGTASMVDTDAKYSSALGYGSSVFAENAVGVGGVVRSGAKYGTALGQNATVDADIEGGVALGANSFATTAKGVTGAYEEKKGAQDPAYAWTSTAAAVSVGDVGNGVTRQITGVAAGTELTDAVNVAQLKAVAKIAADAAGDSAKHTAVTVNGGKDAPADGSYTSGNLQLKKTTKDGKDTYDVKLADDITLGDNGSDEFVTISGSKGTIWASRSIAAGNVIVDGDSGTVSGLSNTTTKYQGFADGSGKAATEEQLKEAVNQAKIDAAAADTHVKAGEYSADKDGKVSLDIVDKDGNSKGTVTITDVAKASDVGDVTKVKDDLKNKEGKTTVVDAINNLDAKVDGISGRVDTIEQSAGKHSSVSAEDANLTITTGENAAKGTDYKISLAKDLAVDSVDAGGVKIGKDGIDANGQKITNVADGTVAGDVVNYGQLSAVEKKVDNNTIAINNISGSVNKLGNRINRVGAGAAALAALHPLDFDPDAKWDFAAGYGNYRGANAAAVGAFYRPNENWMLSLGGSFGGGENMVNAGVSVKLGTGSAHAGTSKAAMAAEIKELRGTVAAQDARLAAQDERLAAQDEKIAQLTALLNAFVGGDKALPETAEEAK